MPTGNITIDIPTNSFGGGNPILKDSKINMARMKAHINIPKIANEK